jgi:hypothetical protein
MVALKTCREGSEIEENKKKKEKKKKKPST